VPVADLAAHLAGTWGLDRDLHDRRAGVRGRLRGTAEFAPDGAGLRWSEAGRLEFGAHAGPAQRVLAIVLGAAGWEVRFADGRPFHPLDLSAGRADVEHPCGEDRYTGRYDVAGPDALLVRWRVKGPTKDLEIVSRYARVPAGRPGAGVA
jgi:uncharacterized protein DUF6314